MTYIIHEHADQFKLDNVGRGNVKGKMNNSVLMYLFFMRGRAISQE